MKDMEKQVKDFIKEVNEETNKQWKDISNKVNADESLNFFGRWATAQETMEKRYRIVKGMLDILRDEGWDIKINMQTYELSYYGRI